MPQELKRLLEQAQQAIDGGDAPAAIAALQLAAVIAPDNSDIAKLQQRAEVLPQLLPLLQAAAAAEAAGDLAAGAAVAATGDGTGSTSISARRSELQRVTHNPASRVSTRP